MPIPNSNLILLIKDLNCPVSDDSHYKMTVEPEPYRNSSDLPCFKADRTLYRRRPASCINQHKNVCTIFVLSRFYIFIYPIKMNNLFFFFICRNLKSNNVEMGTQYQSV